MKPAQHPPTIVSIDRSKLIICTTTHPDPLVFEFSADWIRDLEVANHDGLQSGLDKFLNESKLPSTPVIFVLAGSVCFQKEYPGTIPPKSEDTQKFIDTVPFSNVSSKLFKTPTGYNLVAINRDLYGTIEKAFLVHGYRVIAIVPGFVLGSIGIKEEFTADSCRIVLKKIDFLTANSFSSPKEESQNFHQKEQAFLEKHKAVVAILSLSFVAFAIAMAFITLQRPAPKPYTPPAVTRKAKPTEIPATPVPATPSAEALSAVTVQVLNATGFAGRAATVSASLKSLGFTTVVTGNAPSIISGLPQAAFSSSVDANIRQFVVDQLSVSLPGLTSQVVSDPQYGITITLTR